MTRAPASPPGRTRPGRLLPARSAALLAAATAVTAVTAAALVPASAQAASAPAPRGHGESAQRTPGQALVAERRTLPASATTATGVVARIAVDGHGTHPSGAHAGDLTYLVTDAGSVQVPAADLARVATGARVAVRLGARSTVRGTSPERLAAQGRHVTRVRVLAAAPAGASPTSAATATAAGATAAAAAAPVVEQVTTVLAVPAGRVKDGMTASTFASWLTQTAAPFWAQETEGLVTFSLAAAKSWVTSSYTCAPSNAMQFFNDVAKKAGFTAGAGRHLAIYVPPVKGSDPCPAGLGTVGSSVGSGGSLYVNGTLRSLLTHELGHNLSLDHSNDLKCPTTQDGTWSAATGTWGSGCTKRGYYDLYDVMGFSWEQTGSLNTVHAARLGVLGAGRVVATSTSTRAVLKPLSGHAGLVSLRVADPAGGTYVVEYRTASGRDAYLANNPFYLKPGVTVRRVDPTSSAESLLLDASPTSSSTDYTYVVPQFGTLRTASGRVSLTVEASSSSSATVAVRVDGLEPATTAGRVTTQRRVEDDSLGALRERAVTLSRPVANAGPVH